MFFKKFNPGWILVLMAIFFVVIAVYTAGKIGSQIQNAIEKEKTRIKRTSSPYVHYEFVMVNRYFHTKDGVWKYRLRELVLMKQIFPIEKFDMGRLGCFLGWVGKAKIYNNILVEWLEHESIFGFSHIMYLPEKNLLEVKYDHLMINNHSVEDDCIHFPDAETIIFQRFRWKHQRRHDALRQVVVIKENGDSIVISSTGWIKYYSE